jgi:hypothetical protein
MPIVLHCPCGRTLRIGAEHAGEQGRCPVCGRVLDIPLPESSTEMALPAPSRELGTPSVNPAAGTVLDQASSDATATRQDQEFCPPRYKLYAPSDVVLATFLSNCLGGAWVLARNYRALGRPHAAGMTLGVGIVGAIAVVIVAMAPGLEEIRGLFVALHFGVLLGMYALARYLQGNDYERHLCRGGRKASAWGAAVIGLLSTGICLVGIVVLSWLSEASWGKRVDFGNGEAIYYTSGISGAEARKLGEALRKEGFFDGKSAKTAQLARSGVGLEVSLVVKPNTWNDASVLTSVRHMSARLSEQAFEGRAVTLHLCDGYLTRMTSTQAKRLAFGNGEEIYYSPEIAEADVRRLGRGLLELGWFNGQDPGTVDLQHNGAGWIVSLVVRQGAWDEPNVVPHFNELSQKLSAQAFAGDPVFIHLLDENLVIRKTIPFGQLEAGRQG